MRKRLGMLLATMLCLGVGSAGAGLVNPSFEDPAIPSGEVEINATPTGWTATTSSVYISKVGSLPPPDGLQHVELGNGTLLYQISDLVMQTGVTYTATVYAQSDWREMSGNNAFLSLLAGNNDTVVASTATHADSTSWVLLTVSYVCTEDYAGQLAGVRLGGNAADWCWQSYDMVTLTPEPATMSLLAVGGLGVLVRRKR